MTSTYDLIKALPGKGTDWRGLVDALSARYVTQYAALNDGEAPWPNNTTDEWASAKGVRELRHAAMYAATMITDDKSRRSSFIPPSPETLSWGGFLGGESVVWRDDAAYSEAVEECAAIIRSH